MLATYVEPVRTPKTFEEAANVCEAALHSVLQERVKTEVLALMLAKTVLECGRDTKAGLVWTAAWGHNLGNIKAGPNYAGNFTCITLNEVLKAGVVWFAPEGQLNRKGGAVIGDKYEVPPGHPQTRMRSYANAYDGAHSYVDFVASVRYRDAWTELLEGDADGYVMALHKKGYFTADPAVYAKAVALLHREFMARLAGRAAEPVEVPDCDEVRCILAPQGWNVAAVRAHSQAVATEAYYAMLDDARKAAHDDLKEDT
jgi:hypothetical protein